MLLAMVMTQGWRVFAGGVAAVVLAAGLTARPAAADEIQLSMDAGRVTLVATRAPLTDVLAAWSRVGGDALRGRGGGGRRVGDAAPGRRRGVGGVARPAAPGGRLRGGSAPPGLHGDLAIRPGSSSWVRAAVPLRRPPQSADASPVTARRGAGTPADAPMPLEDMQRLLDAVSGTTGGVAAAAAAAAPGEAGSVPVPAPMTPGQSVPPRRLRSRGWSSKPGRP